MAPTMQAMRLVDANANGDLEEFHAASLHRPIESKHKHYLQHSWTFWFDNPNGKQKQATWGSSLRQVYTFNCVEDFWWSASSSSPLSPILRSRFHCWFLHDWRYFHDI